MKMMQDSDPEAQLPPQFHVLKMLYGAWIAQTISTVARLGIPDLLEKHGASTVDDLAKECSVDRVLLTRVMRSCASIGVFSEDGSGRFGSTELSQVLTAGADPSLKSFAELFGGDWWQPWGRLAEVLQGGRPLMEDPSADPFYLERFNRAMESRLKPLLPILTDHCDLSGARLLVDVGGGFGHVAAAFLQRYPDLRAIVLELPAVVSTSLARLQESNPHLSERLQFVSGDMFRSVPPADVYMLVGVIHDWDDEHCVRLLSHCAEALKAGGRIYCVDHVLPPMGNVEDLWAKFLDLHMMVSSFGRERTEPEWKSLMADAGLKILSIVALTGPVGPRMITAVKA